MIYLGIFLIFLSGLGNPVQTAVNGRLRSLIGSPIVASTVSFTVGLLALCILTLLTQGTLLVPSGIAVEVPWWAWLGGVMGVIGLTGNIVLFPKLGSVQTVLMPTLGQILMSMLIDTFGWFGTTPIPFGWNRTVGVLLVLCGLFAYMRGKASTGKSGSKGLLWPLAGILLGTTFAIQPAMNGKLAVALASSIHAAFISFIGSTVILYAIVLVVRSFRRGLSTVFAEKRPWWIWTGGLIGAFYITMFAWFTPLLGVGIVSLLGILGMLTMSVIIDAKGLLGAKPTHIGRSQYLGLLLILTGLVVIKCL